MAKPYRPFDPRGPQLDEWLDSLTKYNRCVMLHALKYAFPMLNSSFEWNGRCNRACRDLTPRLKEQALMKAMKVTSTLQSKLRETFQ